MELAQPSLRGGIISEVSDRVSLIIYSRNELVNYPATFHGSKNYPATSSVRDSKLSRYFPWVILIVPNGPARVTVMGTQVGVDLRALTTKSVGLSATTTPLKLGNNHQDGTSDDETARYRSTPQDNPMCLG